MQRDNRYKAVLSLITTNEIKSFEQIFNFIPRKTVYTDLGLNYYRFARLLKRPDNFTIRELVTLAGLIGCDPFILFTMAMAKKPVSAKKAARAKK
jgi:hypothetical protein